MKKLILSLLVGLSLQKADAQLFFTTNIASSSFNVCDVPVPVLVSSLTVYATNTTNLRFYDAAVAAFTNLAYTAQGQAIVTYTSYVTNYFPVLVTAPDTYATNVLLFTNTWQGLRTTNYTVAANRGTERPRVIDITVVGNGNANQPVATTFPGRWYFARGLSVSNASANAACTILLQFTK